MQFDLLILVFVIGLGWYFDRRLAELRKVRDAQFRTLLKVLGREDLIS